MVSGTRKKTPVVVDSSTERSSAFSAQGTPHTLMGPVQRLRKLWPAGLALAFAIAFIVLFTPVSTMSRLSNLAMNDAGFRETYLMFSKSEPGKGYVVNRRDSTIRRSHKKLPGGKWDVFQIAAMGTPPMSVWLVQSKRKGRGTVFFIPVTEVVDWTYPFLYQFVREQTENVDLPEVQWTRLFVNRVYQGLYLKVALPFDLRKKDGGDGVLREIFTIQDNRMTYVNTRFDDAPGLYTSSLANGVPLQLAPAPPALTWLSQRRPAEGVTLLMSDQPSPTLSLLPLPVSLPDLFAARNGRAPAGFEDHRFRQWSDETQRTELVGSPPFSDAELAKLEDEFGQYADKLRKELRMHAEFYRLHDLNSQLPGRQAAVADLQLSLGQL